MTLVSFNRSARAEARQRGAGGSGVKTRSPACCLRTVAHFVVSFPSSLEPLASGSAQLANRLALAKLQAHPRRAGGSRDRLPRKPPPTPPGFSQCGLCGAPAQDLDLRSCVRLWISAGSGASLSALSSPASASLRSVARGRGLRSAHGELRRAYRAFITCWQTETGLLLPTGMLPAPYGLAPAAPASPPEGRGRRRK